MPARPRMYFAIIACAFVASRVFYRLLGVRFDAKPLEFYWQFIVPSLLRHDFWRSILYLEQQPPAFNIFLGAVLHSAPKHPVAAFHLAYLCVGLALALSLFALMTRMNADPRVALGITLAFTVSPSTVLYEN